MSHLLDLARELNYPTPFLLVDLQVVRERYRAIRDSVPGVEVFYAVKANDHPAVLRALAAEGSSFEVSSSREMEDLRALGVDPRCIASFNPIKTPSFVGAMEAGGSRLMAVDSVDEVEKIAARAPNAQVAVRINVESEGSDWPLDDKFGVEPFEALPLLRLARQLGLDAAGLTFHVGSQCRNADSWRKAIHRCAAIWEDAAAEDLRMKVLSLGGGMPANHGKPTPSVQEIGTTIWSALRETGLTADRGVRLIVEPGRGVVAEAAIMVTSVIAKAQRSGAEWVFIDAGVFNGLMETICGFQYELSTTSAAAA
ncbi:MAG: type III PLP-dependent enzyme, partial [Chloroflexi bacterium]|nr:type III PLP-dependent enzyme [Chloroflexota bacterium]